MKVSRRSPPMERTVDPAPVEVRMTYHPRAEHARLADLLKSKQAQMIDDVGPASATEMIGCIDKALGLVHAELPSVQQFLIHGRPILSNARRLIASDACRPSSREPSPRQGLLLGRRRRPVAC